MSSKAVSFKNKGKIEVKTEGKLRLKKLKKQIGWGSEGMRRESRQARAREG
jgi:hypothetical protein